MASSRPHKKGWKLTGKHRARIWCELIAHLAPIIRALTALLVVLILIG